MALKSFTAGHLMIHLSMWKSPNCLTAYINLPMETLELRWGTVQMSSVFPFPPFLSDLSHKASLFFKSAMIQGHVVVFLLYFTSKTINRSQDSVLFQSVFLPGISWLYRVDRCGIWMKTKCLLSSRSQGCCSTSWKRRQRAPWRSRWWTVSSQ